MKLGMKIWHNGIDGNIVALSMGDETLLYEFVVVTQDGRNRCVSRWIPWREVVCLGTM